MRPRAVLPQDSLPTEVAGMKISVPRFSLRRLFSSFPPPPARAHGSASFGPPGVAAISPSLPGSPFYTLGTPATSAGKRLPRFTRAYGRVVALASATFSERERGVVHDYRRYQPLLAATTPRRVRCQRQMRKYSAVTGD
jgi:hypothetical protein